jgi:hypothetical protein
MKAQPLINPEHYRSTQTMDAAVRECGKDKLKWDVAQKNPHIICKPAHMFIRGVTEYLFRIASPGMEEVSTYLELHDRLERAMTSSVILDSFKPTIGRFILYLWTLRKLIQTVDHSWVKKSTPIEFDLNIDFDHVPLDWSHFSIEWHWVIFFLGLSEALDESNLDQIPSIIIGKNKNEVKKHPLWKETHKHFCQISDKLPFRLKYTWVDGNSHIINVKSQGDKLYQRLIGLLAVYEWEINLFMKKISEIWLKMRSTEKLEGTDIDEPFRTSIKWQPARWPKEFIEDKKLHTTAMKAVKIGDWKDPEFREFAKVTEKNIEKLFKRAAGYGPGNIGRVENITPEDIKHEIKLLRPDFLRILEVAWPINDIRKQKDSIKNLALDKITPKHINFNWKKVKQNDRLDFLSKICAEYLLDKTGQSYNLKSLRNVIKGTIKG